MEICIWVNLMIITQEAVSEVWELFQRGKGVASIYVILMKG